MRKGTRERKNISSSNSSSSGNIRVIAAVLDIVLTAQTLLVDATMAARVVVAVTRVT
jgi:hypothetical protein